MSFDLDSLSDGQGFLKAGFMGFGGSGKTHSATLLAMAVRKRFSLPGPIAMFDTEQGSAYVGARVQAVTGQKLIGKRSRSLSDLLQVGQLCIDRGVSVLIVDSITHVWRECQDAYMDQLNKSYESRGWSKRVTKLEFQDWGPIKAKFAEWTSFFLNSPLHIIICGRAGYEYDYEKDERGKNQLVKTGTKLKAEAEFEFEPSLMIEMDKEAQENGADFNVATVRKDRFDLINGKVFRFGGKNPPDAIEKQMASVYHAFSPHIEALNPSAGNASIDVSVKTNHGIDETGNAEYARERKNCDILCEEIQGELMKYFPGQSAAEKLCKVHLIEKVFRTKSWKRIETELCAEELRIGLKGMRELLKDPKQVEKDAQAAAGKNAEEEAAGAGKKKAA